MDLEENQYTDINTKKLIKSKVAPTVYVILNMLLIFFIETK